MEITIEQKHEAIEVAYGQKVILMPATHMGYVMYDIVKHFDLYHSLVEPTGMDEKGRVVVDYSKSKVHTYKNGLQFLITSVPEDWELIEKYCQWKQLTDQDIVFDLGAYCGVSTFNFAKLCKHVYAIEPDDQNYAALIGNMMAHRCTNVTAKKLALTKQEEDVAFNQEGAQGSAVHHIIGRATMGQEVTITSTTLERLVELYGLPTFIKMDIEGAELEVLDSSRELLTKHKIPMVIDTHHFVGGDFTTKRVEQILQSCGYMVNSELLGGYWTTWAGKR